MRRNPAWLGGGHIQTVWLPACYISKKEKCSTLSKKKRFYKRTYRSVSDVKKHLLSLLGPTDDIWETSCFLWCHSVMGKSALKSCTLYTYNDKKGHVINSSAWKRIFPNGSSDTSDQNPTHIHQMELVEGDAHFDMILKYVVKLAHKNKNPNWNCWIYPE